MNIKYVGFPGLGFQGKNICVMCVFPLYIFFSFIENVFVIKYCTRLKYIFGIRALLASGVCLCGQGFRSEL
jgi:hypothetical protein